MLHASFSSGPDAAALAFLRENGLDARRDAEFTATLRDDQGRVAATGSLDGRVIKYVACDNALRGRGLTARVVSLLVEEAFARGRTGLFLFTSADAAPLFAALGFETLCAYGGAALLESGGGLRRYIKALAEKAKPGSAGAVVMKADPFTLGHRYLAEYAAARVDRLHIFALREDKAAFPPDVREGLIRAGVADLPNVTVHPGSDYVISAATFPTYFIQETDSRARIQAGLDAALFGRHIAGALGITKRFAGQEPFSPVTAVYNDALAEVLPPLGIEVSIIGRLTADNAPISASAVRKWLAAGDMAAACRLVPPTTAEYLRSGAAASALARLRDTEGSA